MIYLLNEVSKSLYYFIVPQRPRNNTFSSHQKNIQEHYPAPKNSTAKLLITQLLNKTPSIVHSENR